MVAFFPWLPSGSVSNDNCDEGIIKPVLKPIIGHSKVSTCKSTCALAVPVRATANRAVASILLNIFSPKCINIILIS